MCDRLRETGTKQTRRNRTQNTLNRNLLPLALLETSLSHICLRAIPHPHAGEVRCQGLKAVYKVKNVIAFSFYHLRNIARLRPSFSFSSAHLLPPRSPSKTPHRLRYYIQNPADPPEDLRPWGRRAGGTEQLKPCTFCRRYFRMCLFVHLSFLKCMPSISIGFWWVFVFSLLLVEIS